VGTRLAAGRATERIVSAGGLIQELLGCQWGRGIARADDLEPCSQRAVQIVVLHQGEHQVSLKLCARHRDIVLEESTPRGEPS
jgi:hypothetical protein